MLNDVVTYMKIALVIACAAAAYALITLSTNGNTCDILASRASFEPFGKPLLQFLTLCWL